MNTARDRNGHEKMCAELLRQLGRADISRQAAAKILPLRVDGKIQVRCLPATT